MRLKGRQLTYTDFSKSRLSSNPRLPSLPVTSSLGASSASAAATPIPASLKRVRCSTTTTPTFAFQTTCAQHFCRYCRSTLFFNHNSYKMVRKSAKSKDGPPKEPLTLAELAGHDDVCSDVMVDNVSQVRRVAVARILTTSRPSTSSRSGSTDQNTSP
jgi:hypothetical protein